MSAGQRLVIAISAHSLFAGAGPTRTASAPGEDDAPRLAPGAGLRLVRAFVALGAGQRVDVLLASKEDAAGSLPVLTALRAEGVDVPRTAFTGGASLAPYLKAFGADLFLACDESELRDAAEAGVAGALVWEHEAPGLLDEIRIAVDGDAVVFGAELEAEPGASGAEGSRGASEDPLARLVHAVAWLQREVGEGPRIRTALVTSGTAAEQERLVGVLHRAGLHLDEAYALAGAPRHEVLAAFGPHLVCEGRDGPHDDAKPYDETPTLVAPVDEGSGEPEATGADDASEDASGLGSALGRLRFRSSD